MRLAVCGLALALAATGCESTGQVRSDHFTAATVDFGIVVSDIEKAAAFYRDAVGMTEFSQFHVPAGMAGDSGLTDYKPFDVRVFVLADAPTATKVKLIQSPGGDSKQVDHAYIDSSLGVSYLTLFVTDIDAAVERAGRYGVRPLARGPVALPEGFPQGIYLACVRDPDGNIVEFVGPRKAAQP